MDTIIEMIRHIVVFILIASLIGNLLVDGEYRKYLSYATGLIVMVMVLVPVLSLMGKERNWEDYLIQADYRQKAEETKKEIAMLGEEYEKKVEKQYEAALRTEVAGLVGVEAERCIIRMREGKVRSIRVKVRQMPSSIDTIITSLSLRYGVEKDNIFIEEG